MGLKEKILKNREKFEKTNKVHNILNEELLKFLGEDLYTAPASNMESMYNAYPGGLIDHILKVTKYTLFLNDSLPENIRLTKESIIKVCFIHQIGKVKLFKFCESEWHRKNQGKMYDFNNDLVSMRVSERSLYYAMSNGVKFTEEEYSAIMMFDKADDQMAQYHNSTLGELLKMSNIFAIKHEKSE